MWILQIVILLLSIAPLKASDQEDACTEVQQKLEALSAAIETVCGHGSTPPSTTLEQQQQQQNTTAQPAPIEQLQCECTPAVTWTSVTRTLIGFSHLRLVGTLAYDIPSVIPNSAREVLVVIFVYIHISGPPGHAHYVKIYTEQDQEQYEKYFLMMAHGESSTDIYSDNLWFPMTSGRQIFVKSETAHTGLLTVEIHAIGYR